jgi:hypothetical protein
MTSVFEKSDFRITNASNMMRAAAGLEPAQEIAS